MGGALRTVSHAELHVDGAEAHPAFTTVIILLLLIGSILMLSLGIIGYYIAELFLEIKGRLCAPITRDRIRVSTPSTVTICMGAEE